ncbi:MAG TPA: MMPL family transporter [Bacteroidales bacterium]|nr:MMPL family transporter [Bacteroidales bacterium]
MFFLLKHKTLVIIVFALITAVSLWQMTKLRVNNELDIWIGRNGAEYDVYQEYIKQFGLDESIILLIRSDSIFTTRFLQGLRGFTDSLQTIPGVSEVTALTTVAIPVQSLAGVYEVPLVPDPPLNPEKVRLKAMKYRSLKDHLVSADGKTTAIEIQLHSTQQMDSVLKAVETLAERNRKGLGSIVPFGIVPVKSEINRLSTSEAALFFSLAILIMLTLTWLFFRRFLLALIPVAIALVTIVWVLGLMASCGVTLNILLSSMPLILLVISIAYSIHYISAASVLQNQTTDRRELAVSAFSAIFRNSLFSALTTMVAMLVFTITAITPLRHFGLFAGIGVALAFIITFSILPIVYAVWKMPVIPENHSMAWTRLFGRLDRFTRQYRVFVFVACALLLVFAVFGISRLEVNTDQKTYLKRNNPLRIQTEQAEQWMSGIVPVELIIHLDAGLFSDFQHYNEEFRKIEEILGTNPDVQSWQSYRLLLDDFFPEEGALFSSFSLTPEMVQDNMALQRFISCDGKTVRITVKTGWKSDNQILEFVRNLEEQVHEVMATDQVSVQCTGAMPVFAMMGKRLVRSQILSIFGAFVLIFILFVFIYKNAGWSLLAMIPNVLPVAITLGVMGFLHISVDVATVLITSVSFGIAVDDTIHFTNTFRNLRRSLPAAEAVTRSFHHIGRPLVITSLLLMAGFLVLAFSDYRPLIFLGVFISLNLLLALLFDLILVPVLLHSREKS